MGEPVTSPLQRLQRSVNIVHNPLAGWAILALSLMLTFAAYWFSSAQVRARVEEQFEFRAHEIDVAIEERMAIYEQALRSGVGFFNASEETTREEWRIFVDSLQLRKRLPGIQGMGFAVPLQPDELASHTAAIRAQGFTDYAVRPVEERDEYSAIVYLEPFDWRNQRAFGYDMWSDELRREAMRRARDTGEAATSRVITLVQETNADVQKGFLTYLPVYQGAEVPDSIDERRQTFRGWVYAAFRSADLMAGILGSSDTDIAFEIYDGEVVQPETLLYDSDNQLSLLDATPKPLLTRTRSLELQGRQWTVVYSAPKQALFAHSDGRQPFYVLIAGIIIDTLLFYVIVSLHLINRHAQRATALLRQEHEQNQQSLAAQMQLVEANKREAEVFFELAPEAFVVVDANGRIINANRHAHELFGYSENNLYDVALVSLLPATAVANEQNATTGTNSESCQAVKLNGQAFAAQVKVVPIDYRGAAHRVVAVRDVSQQKEIENTLARAKDDAESASRSKSEFVANMSHEIRTPLNAVLGAAQLLEKSRSPSEHKKYVHMIRSSGEVLLGIINDILDFSKIEAGAMELTPVAFDLHEVLSRVAIMMSVSCGEKNIELVIRVEPRVKSKLIADPLRLQQVLINLVSNAIKFTDAGEVVLSVEADGQEKNGKQHVRFCVSDTGIGMDAAHQARLFKAFFQADASISRRFGGTGLGLVISSRIVALMGSHIQLESEPGAGSRFLFDVLLPVSGDVHVNPDWPTVGAKSVLVLDDHPASCDSLREILSAWQWRCRCFRRWQALEQPDNKELLQTFDFVLIDYSLDPKGPEYVLNRLKAMGLARSCAAVLVFGNNQQAAMMAPAVQQQFSSSLIKPVISPFLIEALHEASLTRTGEPLRPARHPTLPTSTGLAGMRALLVEDNVFNQTVAQNLLADMGVQTEIANNGAEAIHKVNDADGAFDVIFMDIQMPLMDGIAATVKLREQSTFRGPIIAMTAGVLGSQFEQYRAAGMDDLVAKPVDRNDLLRVLSRVLQDVPQIANERPLGPAQARQVFSAARLEQLTRGKSKRIRSVIDSLKGIFVEAGAVLGAAAEAIHLGDNARARSELHALKGVVANYGAEQLADALALLEQRLDGAPDPVAIDAQIDAVRQHITEYQQQAQQWIAGQELALGEADET